MNFDFSIRRVYGYTLRHLYYMRRSVDKLISITWWPLVDIILWGVSSYFFAEATGDKTLLTSMLICVILWGGLLQTQVGVTSSLLEDIWSRNFVNIFVTPLRKIEFVASLMAISATMTFLAFITSSVAAYILFGVNLIDYAGLILPLYPIVLVSGWSVGLAFKAVILKYGTNMQSISWILIWVLSPFCGVFYPVSILPDWAVFISKLIPLSYATTEVRAVVAGAGMNWGNIGQGYLLSLFTFGLAYLLFHLSFKGALNRGLAKIG